MAPELATAISLQPEPLVFALALALDASVGEPPNALHPVVWIGNAIALCTRAAPSSGPRRQLLAGAMIALVIPALAALASAGLLAALQRIPLLHTLAAALLLKASFALRALRNAAEAVRGELVAGRIDGARAGLRSLCSRDPQRMDEPQLVAGTIESLAENTSDSFVAPLFYYACFGVPGAVFYRAVNTLDAMIGYHGRYEYLGKASARLDDVLNFIPARLTAAALLVAGWLGRANVLAGLRILWRDGACTESPNAGRPMAAMAGLLEIALEKPGHYRLGDHGRSLQPALISRASRLVLLCAGLTAGLLALAIWGVRHAPAG